jgi:hypothetical protein
MANRAARTSTRSSLTFRSRLSVGRHFPEQARCGCERTPSIVAQGLLEAHVRLLGAIGSGSGTQHGLRLLAAFRAVKTLSRIDSPSAHR